MRVTKGQAAPELEPVLARAAALAQQVGEPSQHFAVLVRCGRSITYGRETRRRRPWRSSSSTWPNASTTPPCSWGPTTRWGHLVQRRRLGPSRTHLEQGIALYDPQRHATPHHPWGDAELRGELPCPGGRGPVGAGLSGPGRAAESGGADHGACAGAPLHPGGCAALECSTPCPPPGVADGPGARRGLLALATEHGFARYVALGAYLRGWALAAQGQGEEGIAQMRQGLAALRATGASAAACQLYLAQLAEAYGQVGQVDEGLHLLAEALAVVDTTGGARYEAELHRLHGELLLRQAVPDAPGRSLLPAGPRRGPPPAGQVLGAAGRHEPEPAVAAARASAPKPASCWHRSTAGSPRALTPRGGGGGGGGGGPPPRRGGAAALRAADLLSEPTAQEVEAVQAFDATHSPADQKRMLTRWRQLKLSPASLRSSCEPGTGARISARLLPRVQRLGEVLCHGAWEYLGPTGG